MTPINHHLVGPEIAYIVTDSGAKAPFGHDGLPASWPRSRTNSRDDLPPAYALGEVAGFKTFEELIDGQPTTPPAARTAGAPMHYTSGYHRQAQGGETGPGRHGS